MARKTTVIRYEWHNQPQNVIINGRQFEFKSKIEYKWAQYLQMLLELGAIEFWDYEPKRFEFKERYRRRRVYTPDFVVREKFQGLMQTVYHEVKTALRQTDVMRFKLMHYDFPMVNMVLVLPCCRTGRQAILRGNALKYVERVVYCNPLFNQFGIK